MVVVKISFGKDLRRITVENDASLREVTDHIKTLFNLPLSFCRLILIHIKEDDSKEVISNDKQFQQAIITANDSRNKILRLEIQSAKPEVQPIPLSPLQKEKDVLLDNPDVRAQLETIILETVQSKPFIDTIIQKFFEQTKESQPSIEEKQVQSVVVEAIPQVLSNLQKEVEKAPIESIKEIPKQIDEVPKIEKVVQQEQNIEEKKVIEAQEDSFVLVPDQPEENRIESGTSPLVRSFLSIFKSFKKEEPKQPQQKMIPKEKLEEMLKQLRDMGFTDDEVNMKALHFHYKFNEGLDAVIEDLLISAQKNPIDEIPPVQPEQAKEIEQPKEKGIQMQNIPEDGIPETDISRLMSHANITREAAIKALKSQVW